MVISSEFNNNEFFNSLMKIKSSIITHLEFNKIIEAIFECHQSSNDGCPCNLLLTGSSGTGKSALLSYYINKYLEIYKGDSVFPILYLKLPLQAKPEELAISLLEEMDINYSNNLSLSSLTNKVVQSIAKSGIELIVLDDIEHLFNINTGRIHSDSVEWLRMLFEKLQISFILSGLDISTRLLNHNEAFASRILSTLTLSPLDQDEYDRFLQDIDSCLPFSEKSCLTEENVTEKLYLTSGGFPGYTKELIIKATRLAFNEDRLTEWHILKSCNLLSNPQNPMNLNFDILNERLHKGKIRGKSEKQYKQRLQK
ncbi:TniB family NTP-binding protein [Paenibacillus sp. FSL H7-0331]|uniref:TniB family NTP-binding protein n=1 Tax=Paenibacillus sp. FSL H7-0331 TaxID=1920421 RepID=UPI002116C014|nr:TniB family NTP-binding protein [Paenibacillus sp. FSL H7-0331]